MTDLTQEIEFSEDVKTQELQSLEIIYPSIKINYETLSGSLDIPVKNDKGIEIVYKSDNSKIEKQKVFYLPAIKFTFRLMERYPYDEPPVLRIFSNVVSSAKSSTLLKELLQCWEDLKDCIIFTLVEMIQNKIHYEFKEFIGSVIECESIERFNYLSKFNKDEEQLAFNKSTYLCGICQTDYKGEFCSKFECGHVFCNDCLFEYFTSLIESGSIERVHCPEYECTTKLSKIREKYLRLDNITNEAFDFNEFKCHLMTPPISLDLLRSILVKRTSDSEKFIARYRDLFMRQNHAIISKLFPTRLVPCFNENCPEMIFREDLTDPLVICRRCNSAFCQRCRKSWHGKYVECKGKRGLYSNIPIKALDLWIESLEDSEERKKLSSMYGRNAMAKMSEEYRMDILFDEMLKEKDNSLQKCPVCEIVIQRSDGCNKMKCSTCQTLFCNLCGCFLNPDDPYYHFNDKQSDCYGRLFEGLVKNDD